MDITVKEITTIGGLKQFIRFPHTIFKGSEFWVPPLHGDEMNTLRWDKNPAFEYSEARYWMAYKEKKPVGRIAAIINHRANQKWGYKHMRFGWVDFIEDMDVASALFSEVEKWAAEKEMDAVEGPLGFTDMDFEGMLIEGFDKLPTIANIYNYPYYPRFVEELGYKPTEDWIQLKLNTSQPVPEKLERINKIVLEKYKDKLHVGQFKNTKEIVKYGKKLFHTLNKCFVNLYGFVELTDKEIDRYIKNYLGFIKPELICIILDDKDDVVGFGIAMPTLSKAFQKANGKLFPFGFIHILKAMKNFDQIDLYLTGVLPDWQNKGITAIYYTKVHNSVHRMGVKTAITNHQLVDNHGTLSMWKNYENEPYLKRRCYIKDL